MNKQQTFCKSRNCPSTDALLLFSNDALQPNKIQAISKHLEKCDFCNAEITLLSDFAEHNENRATPELPFQLRQLAEIMLSGKTHEHRFLRRLFAQK